MPGTETGILLACAVAALAGSLAPWGYADYSYEGDYLKLRWVAVALAVAGLAGVGLFWRRRNRGLTAFVALAAIAGSALALYAVAMAVPDYDVSVRPGGYLAVVAWPCLALVAAYVTGREVGVMLAIAPVALVGSLGRWGSDDWGDAMVVPWLRIPAITLGVVFVVVLAAFLLLRDRRLLAASAAVALAGTGCALAAFIELRSRYEVSTKWGMYTTVTGWLCILAVSGGAVLWEPLARLRAAAVETRRPVTH